MAMAGRLRKAGNAVYRGGAAFGKGIKDIYDEGISETLLHKEAEILENSQGGSITTLLATVVGFGGKLVTGWFVWGTVRLLFEKQNQTGLITDDPTLKTMNYLGYFGQQHWKDTYVAPDATADPEVVGVVVDGSAPENWADLDPPIPFDNIKIYALLSALLTSFMAFVYLMRMIPVVEKVTFGGEGNSAVSTILYHVLDAHRYLVLSFDVMIFIWAEIFSYQLSFVDVPNGMRSWIQTNFVFTIFLATALTHIERQLVSMGIAQAGINFMGYAEIKKGLGPEINNLNNFRSKYLRPVRGYDEHA